MDDDTLGPCGCTDYHMADCPLVTSRWEQDDSEEMWLVGDDD